MNHDLEDEMCPNCVTPWKCNGPHILEGDNEMNEHVSQWRGLDEEQKASIAIELLTEFIEEVEFWKRESFKKKDYKAAKRTRNALIKHYGLLEGTL